MEALRLILRYAHLVGFALLLGGAVTQYLSGVIKINSAVLWGSIIQLVTGIALAAPFERAVPLNHVKLGVKGAIALLIFLAVFMVRKKPTIAKGHFFGIVGMTLLNAAIAVFWR
jgi:hypothetical protein